MVDRHIFSLGFFKSTFIHPFHTLFLLFVVTPCLIVAVRLRMELNPIETKKKNNNKKQTNKQNSGYPTDKVLATTYKTVVKQWFYKSVKNLEVI